MDKKKNMKWGAPKDEQVFIIKLKPNEKGGEK